MQRNDLPELVFRTGADGHVQMDFESRGDLSQALSGGWTVKTAGDAVVLWPDRMPSPLLSPTISVTLLDARWIRGGVFLLGLLHFHQP